MTKAWRIAGSRTIVKDRWTDLRADRCLTPAGTEIAPYYVLSYPDWVHVVAVTADDRMVLVRQYRHAVGETVLELPGGVIDASDRDPEAAARRELAEETGYGLARGAWSAASIRIPPPTPTMSMSPSRSAPIRTSVRHSTRARRASRP